MSYFNGWRQSVEDRLRRFVIELGKLAARLARAEANIQALAGRGSGNGSGGGGGAYADPGSTVVAAGDEAELTVMEPRAGGDDAEIGTKTVLNRFSTDTATDLRLMLVKCGDGSYLIVNQDYPCS